ncbi:MAG: RNA polymerase sigma factor [Rhodothermales bacterium]
MSFRQRSYRLLSDAVLLERLFSEDAMTASYAWREFLRRYSRLFLKVIWQFERDVDAAMETYAYVCARLAANECARLRKFQPAGRAVPPKLSTWLTIVVKNLCIEHRRVEQGRRRLPRALTRLSAFDQKVFALYYWKGCTPHEIEQVLEGEARQRGFSVAAALDRIEALALRPSKTWLNGSPTFVPFNEQYHVQDDAPALLADVRAVSETLLDALTPEERLVVRLRFWEDLTAQEIAHILQRLTPRQVYSVLDRALKKMRQCARQEV